MKEDKDEGNQSNNKDEINKIGKSNDYASSSIKIEKTNTKLPIID